MSQRGSHAGKSKQERDSYSRYIAGLDYDSTGLDSSVFSPTGQTGEELGEPTSKRKRRSSIGRRIKEHFSENWPEYLITIFLLGIIGWVYSIKIDVVGLEKDMLSTTGDVQEIKNDVRDLAKKNYDRDLKTQNIEQRVLFIEQSRKK